MAVCKFNKKHTLQKEFRELSKCAKGQGLDTEEMCKFLDKINMEYEVVEHAKQTDIEDAINNGYIPIAMIFAVYLNKHWVSGNHTVIVKGYDNKHYYIANPAKTVIEKIEKDNFCNVWFETKEDYIGRNILLVIKGFKE
jgi:ABC-type bacteriocin/lantibiotic exporter with double-glycine peptidase domain